MTKLVLVRREDRNEKFGCAGFAHCSNSFSFPDGDCAVLLYVLAARLLESI